VDTLLQALDEPELIVRSSVLKALNRLRDAKPNLNYGKESLMRHILEEARSYYELQAALSPVREKRMNGAGRLLASTIEQRLQAGLDRVFRLLGLRYPPKEIYAAYLAIKGRHKSEEFTAALEFLDNVLERELKRVLLPLLDDDIRVQQTGHDLFGVEIKDLKTALRELIRSGDAWLVACAVATAAELRMKDVVPDIEPLAKQASPELRTVAESALAVLSA
jgi:AAA family ATP:ADP antiporter